jgi:hypothetical protein
MQMQVFEGLEYSEVEVFQKIIIIFIASYKSLQNNIGHVKKLITIEVIIHEIKKGYNLHTYIK